jgi:ADP-L-glycero-D-manno-heptose 6-epimerase
MKILITGHKGFIGRNLRNYLSIDHEKNEVYGIDSEIFDNGVYWKNELKNKLNQIEPTVVFHLGACTDTLEQDVNYMMDRNFESTKIISDYCLLNSIPLIYSSSAACYGSGRGHPINLYGWSKYVAEQYVISNNGIALRYFNVYGPHEEHKEKMSSVAFQSFIKKMKNEPVKLFSGFPKRDFVHVMDVVLANLYAYKHYNTLSGKFYDVGVGEARLFEDVLQLMEVDFKHEKINKIPKGYQFYTCANIDKFMNGWSPRYPLELGIKTYKQYLDENFSNR